MPKLCSSTIASWAAEFISTFARVFCLILLTEAVGDTALAADCTIIPTQSWGGAGSSPGQLHAPFGIASDGQGRLYVSDQGNHRIQVFTESGSLVGGWSTGENSNPRGIAISPDGSICVAAVAPGLYGTVMRFAQDGSQLKSCGNLSGYLGGIAIAHDGRIFVVDTGNNQVVRFNSTGIEEGRWPVRIGPTGITIDQANYVYVCDASNASRIWKYTDTGVLVTSWGEFGEGPSQLQYPLGLFVDGGGTIYCADSFNYRMHLYDTAGNSLCTWGSGGSGLAQFNIPSGAVALPNGDVYVVDSGNSRIVRYTWVPTGIRNTTWGGLKILYR